MAFDWFCVQTDDLVTWEMREKKKTKRSKSLKKIVVIFIDFSFAKTIYEEEKKIEIRKCINNKKIRKCINKNINNTTK